MPKPRVGDTRLGSSRIGQLTSPRRPRPGLTYTAEDISPVNISTEAVLLPDCERNLGYHHVQTCKGLENARFRAFLVPSHAHTEHGFLPRLQRTHMWGAV